MRYSFVFITALGALTACGGNGPSTEPCTTCPNVAGTYDESSAKTSVTCKAGDMLEWSGSARTVSLTQTQSILNLSGSDLSVSGTLHEDLSVSFAPLRANAVSLNDGSLEPGNLYITGQFSATAPRSFNSTYSFVRDSDGCRINATAHWALH